MSHEKKMEINDSWLRISALTEVFYTDYRVWSCKRPSSQWGLSKVNQAMVIIFCEENKILIKHNGHNIILQKMF